MNDGRFIVTGSFTTATGAAKYVPIKYTKRFFEACVEPSVGSVGDSCDNVLAETINGLYKAEVIHRRAPPGETSRPSSSLPSNGSTGSTTEGSWSPSATLPSVEAEQRYYAMPEQPAMAA